MNKSDNLAKELSEQLAKIFYCVAAADKIIRKEEVYSLQNILKDQWTDLDAVSPILPKSFGVQIQFCFDEILKNEPDVESTISEFKDFFKNHENLFSDSLKRLTVQTLFAVSSAFAANNKSELTIISTIYLLFYPLKK